MISVLTLPEHVLFSGLVLTLLCFVCFIRVFAGLPLQWQTAHLWKERAFNQEES